MSCLRPNVMRCFVDPDTGELKYIFEGSYSSASCPVSDFSDFGNYSFLSNKNEFHFVVPCRHCLGCRMDYARQWRDRMLFELHDSSSAVFVTLTYNPESLPTNTFFDFDLQTEIVEPTLSVRDVQLFFKRLRKKFTGRRIRYYLCGEYGPKTFRPHYHAIIYGLSMVDFPDAVIQGYNELGQAHFSSLSFDNIWSKGFCRFSPVSSQTCAYVSRYVTKKHYKSIDPKFFSRGRSPEFSLSSRNPGIGFLHAAEYVSSGQTKFTFTFPDRAVTLGLPSSFIQHCRRNSLLDIDFLDQIRYNRSVDSYERINSMLQFLELPFSRYLKQQSDSLCDRLKIIPERSNF